MGHLVNIAARRRLPTSDQQTDDPEEAAMPIASFALAAAQMASPVSLDSGFAVNQAMGFQQDAQGNRVVISGTSQLSTGTSGGGTQSRLMPSWGVTATTSQATAIGNLVSVTITGNNNTVQLDTTQINLGNQTAIVGELPNGSGN
ncbi:hypothetical protein AWH62_05385 [Maricaulis sp. W15]|nr:hypothetical protein AWH62_05385 [Maricaulis sp. W15]